MFAVFVDLLKAFDSVHRPVLAPLLFLIFFSMMLRVAFNDCDRGIHVHYTAQTETHSTFADSLQAKTKVSTVLVSDLLFADDCALVAHTQAGIQELFDRYFTSAKRFGLSVSIKKTVALHRSAVPAEPPRKRDSNCGWRLASQVRQQVLLSGQL